MWRGRRGGRRGMSPSAASAVRGAAPRVLLHADDLHRGRGARRVRRPIDVVHEHGEDLVVDDDLLGDRPNWEETDKQAPNKVVRSASDRCKRGSGRRTGHLGADLLTCTEPVTPGERRVRHERADAVRGRRVDAEARLELRCRLGVERSEILRDDGAAVAPALGLAARKPLPRLRERYRAVDALKIWGAAQVRERRHRDAQVEERAEADGRAAQEPVDVHQEGRHAVRPEVERRYSIGRLQRVVGPRVGVRAGRQREQGRIHRERLEFDRCDRLRSVRW